MKQNFKLTVTYDGTRYHGWEAKPNIEMTIQGKLETVLTRMLENAEVAPIENLSNGTKEAGPSPVKVIGAGRTDAGVHAREMTANVHLDTAMLPGDIRDYLNRYLPEDICVR